MHLWLHIHLLRTLKALVCADPEVEGRVAGGPDPLEKSQSYKIS